MRSLPDLYGLLGVGPDASSKEVTRAFRIKALSLHPDKRSGVSADTATRDFQALESAYRILKDPLRRQSYDRTGWADEESCQPFSCDSWRPAAVQVTEQDISYFERHYKGSAEEIEDLSDFYNKQKGDVERLLEYIPLSESEETERFIGILELLIAEKKLKRRKIFKASCEKLRRQAKRYASKAKKEGLQLVEAVQTSKQDLIRAIQENQRNRGNSFLEMLESKYT